MFAKAVQPTGLHLPVHDGHSSHPAEDNIVADMLFRIEAITAPETHDELAAAQDDDDELRTLLVNTALQLENLLVPSTSVGLYCDTSAGKPRLYVPSPLLCRVFKA